jgi:ADP-ribose pyrophosphatase YjhB (NUDIX family)
VTALPDRRPRWFRWAQRVQSIAQTGLAYCTSEYDRERYEELRQMAVEMVSFESGASEEQLRVSFASGVGYPTPKLDVRAVVFRGDEILLVREARTGGWTLPGGWADVGDTPGEAAERETREESGYEVKASRLIALLDKSRHDHPPALEYAYKAFVLCKLVGGEERTSHETSGVGFFARNAIPPLDTERTAVSQIDLAYRHLADPNLPAEFD